jgi:hypothetical protein
MTSSPARTLKHTRAITVQVYARDDGLWDIDAHICDVKTRDYPLASGVRKVGDPVHDMTLTLTVDTTLNVRDARAHTEKMPYPGYCNAYGDAYQALIGLNLFKGFRSAVAERLGGVRGCTHLTELALVLPTAAIQAFAGEVLNTQENGEASDVRPFQLDRCHALKSDAPAVATYYPKWYAAPETNRAV